MKKINLSPYNIKITKNGIEEDMPFKVKESIIELLFISQLKLNGAALLNQYTLAEKIKKAEDFVLLEDEEYNRVKRSFELFDSFDKSAVELVKRVLDAETVDVKPVD
jgi:hypothetical protein